MVETPRLWPIAALLIAASCASPEPEVAQAPPPAPIAPAAPAPDPAIEQARVAEAAKALLAQAETDIQRARAKRALWLPAWADLLSARDAMSSGDAARSIRYAKRASEFAQLGLEQLAYPAVSVAGDEESR